MLAGRDEGPVYYREIQKNAYLKRIPNEIGGSKLRPLGHKKPPLKPMWTLFCVHNGRTPFLEQYPDPESPLTLTHKPTWRACLKTTRHVTASVKPHVGDEYDFLVDTDHGPVRMVAPDWDSMQDWVNTLRNKLQELKIMSGGENVYAPPPVAPPVRAPARDPTSPLPPTPPIPPDRVPGIELNVPNIRPVPVTNESPNLSTETEINQNTVNSSSNVDNGEQQVERENIDISNWDTSFSSLPSTSQETRNETKKLAKICGQNICLDDSIFKRNAGTNDSDDESFTESDRRLSENVTVNVESDQSVDIEDGYKHRVVVSSNEIDKPCSAQIPNENSDYHGTNITVIQVSNKGPPHTAIPIVGAENDIFNFDFRHQVSLDEQEQFINIVNTEIDVNNSDNGYGTVFSDNSQYGHLSLTTTVNLTGNEKEGIYERLCMASTSHTERGSPRPVRSIIAREKLRKSSLPNLDTNTEPDYEYLFPTPNSGQNLGIANKVQIVNKNVQDRSNTHEICNNASQSNNIPNSNRVENLNFNANSNQVTNSNQVHSPNQVTNSNQVTNANQVTNFNYNQGTISNSIQVSNTSSVQVSNSNSNTRVNLNTTSTASINANVISSRLRSNVERSHSQNAYDSTPRLREQLIRRLQNSSPKHDGNRNEKSESPPKPIWKRGLTELSLLSRLRGIGQSKRQESPNRQEDSAANRNVTVSTDKVVRRSRPEVRLDNARRRSNSLNNGEGVNSVVRAGLQTLRQRQVACLRAEQLRGAAIPATVPVREPPILALYNDQVWVSWWGVGGGRCAGRAGDRVLSVRGAALRDVAHARQLIKTAHAHLVDILFHRVPLGKIYVLNKRDHETLGIKLDNECVITGVESSSPAGRAGIPPPGKWAVTEVNNRPINLIKGGEEAMNRLSMHGSEVSILIQPAALVKKLRAAIKANKALVSLR